MSDCQRENEYLEKSSFSYNFQGISRAEIRLANIGFQREQKKASKILIFSSMDD
jgi:hypothetical protein